MEEFTEVLEEATRAVPAEYFLLPQHGADPIYRERVYCYELYHQMRDIWPRDTHYRLNGEVDKRNHPYFQDAAQPKPDMIVHRPGTGDNFAAIEVKVAGAENREITKDLLTLRLFAQIGYRRFMYLIYGEDARGICRESGHALVNSTACRRLRCGSPRPGRARLSCPPRLCCGWLLRIGFAEYLSIGETRQVDSIPATRTGPYHRVNHDTATL